MIKKNKILNQNPPEIDKISRLREKLKDTDRDDHLIIIDEMEAKVKKSLIKLALLDHEGIGHLRDMAKSSIKEIHQLLIQEPPKDITPDAAMAYIFNHKVLSNKKAIWMQFLQFFTDAEADLKELNADLDFQLAPDAPESSGE